MHHYVLISKKEVERSYMVYSKLYGKLYWFFLPQERGGGFEGSFLTSLFFLVVGGRKCIIPTTPPHDFFFVFFCCFFGAICRRDAFLVYTNVQMCAVCAIPLCPLLCDQ